MRRCSQDPLTRSVSSSRVSRAALWTEFPSRVPDGRPSRYPPLVSSLTGPTLLGRRPCCQWFDRSGRRTVAVDTPAQYIGFAISPDSRQLAFARTGKNGGV